jgi:ribosomal-protein-alanine N-acetyltransferase
MGVRRRYYSDNGEDALVMWTDALDADSFQMTLEQNERKLADRLGSAEVRLGDSIWSLPNG